KGLAEDERAERVGRYQRIPFGNVLTSSIVISIGAGELRALDIEADPLQRCAMPGLQVELPGWLAVPVRLQQVAHDETCPRRELVMLTAVTDHDAATIWHGELAVAGDPHALQPGVTAPQLLVDGARVAGVLSGTVAVEH